MEMPTLPAADEKPNSAIFFLHRVDVFRRRNSAGDVVIRLTNGSRADRRLTSAGGWRDRALADMRKEEMEAKQRCPALAPDFCLFPD